ncbi:transmembrane protein 25 isoform X1 [Arapaima gigas]
MTPPYPQPPPYPSGPLRSQLCAQSLWGPGFERLIPRGSWHGLGQCDCAVRRSATMQYVCVKQGLSTALLLLHTWTWVQTEAIEPIPKIDGKLHSAVTLKENATQQFKCQSEGWTPQRPPLLTWYLNGERQTQTSGDRTSQLVLTPRETGREQERGFKPNSTFTLHARKWDRELVCGVADPQSGKSYNATVVLNVQYQPEILRVNAHYSETSDPGLSLVLFALVRSNPPATITWVDQTGHVVANTSDFLILDSHGYPWLTNHTLHVSASSLSGNVSVKASNSLGYAQSNLTLAEILQTRVEVPLLGIVTGGAVGFMTLLIFTLLLLFLLHKNKVKDIEKPVEITIPKSESPPVWIDSVHLPRENMSLPSNLQLNDLQTLCRGATSKQGEEDSNDQDLSAAYAARGFTRFPMVGYIYKVNSMSSDEIWL